MSALCRPIMTSVWIVIIWHLNRQYVTLELNILHCIVRQSRFSGQPVWKSILVSVQKRRLWSSVFHTTILQHQLNAVLNISLHYITTILFYPIRDKSVPPISSTEVDQSATNSVVVNKSIEFEIPVSVASTTAAAAAAAAATVGRGSFVWLRYGGNLVGSLVEFLTNCLWCVCVCVCSPFA